MTERNRAPLLDKALDDDEAALPALIELLVIAAGADGAMVCVGAGTQQLTVLSSVPSGLGGRVQHLSAELLAVCGKGVVATGRILLPSSTVPWLGFPPSAVYGVRVSLEPGALSYLYFWWREMPSPAPDLTAIETQGILLLRSFAGRYSSALRLIRLQERLDTVLLNVSLGIVFVDLLAGSLLNPIAANWLNLPADTRETAKVVAAMRRMQSLCTVVPERLRKRMARRERRSTGSGTSAIWFCGWKAMRWARRTLRDASGCLPT